jgi:hypothetical protein
MAFLTPCIWQGGRDESDANRELLHSASTVNIQNLDKGLGLDILGELIKQVYVVQRCMMCSLKTNSGCHCPHLYFVASSGCGCAISVQS